MQPIPSHQKHLIIAFLAGYLGGSGDTADAHWLVDREHIWRWLEERRPFFPLSSSQELVSLAIAPEDLRDEILCTMCDIDYKAPLSMAPVASSFTPIDFKHYTESTAICLVHASSVGHEGQSPQYLAAAVDVFERHLTLALGQVLRLPKGLGPLSKNHASKIDDVAGIFAWRDKQILSLDTPKPAPVSLPSPKSRI